MMDPVEAHNGKPTIGLVDDIGVGDVAGVGAASRWKATITPASPPRAIIEARAAARMRLRRSRRLAHAKVRSSMSAGGR